MNRNPRLKSNTSQMIFNVLDTVAFIAVSRTPASGDATKTCLQPGATGAGLVELVDAVKGGMTA